ncbi:MAG: lactococcin 972 family bacteriocin [Sarcina ventriculi]
MNKKICTLLLTGAMSLGIGGNIALATDNVNQTSGSIEITDNMKQSRASVSVGGGTWDYGTSLYQVTKKKVYSNYLHPTKTHAASCSIGTTMSDSGWASAKRIAQSSAVGKTSDTTNAYWRVQ